MRKIVIVCIAISLTGCTSLATSISGTFIGNIASDKVLKEWDKMEKQNGRQKTVYKSNKH